ncbi:MAG: peptide chain release factor N(5)-glutamine methyltransferase [Leptolyngbyaceae cyanobacterium MO_188.B28]|nr:peptide chain release factor N(5)-glutamine methyltransferase [Leptolyngbyaceae cyanobacterium MO_188.B28]
MESSGRSSANHCVLVKELWRWRRQACQQAAREGVPEQEVDWLLKEVAGVDRSSLRLGMLDEQAKLTLQRSLSDLSQLWRRRIEARIPVQYLAGVVHWRHFSLIVSPAVLIPRPETELLIDLAIATVDQSPIASKLRQSPWVDLGTGSGAIALGLADAFPKAQIYAVDRSGEALAIAHKNALQMHLENRIEFLQGNWFQPLEGCQDKLGGMVSNPPYIPSQAVLALSPEITRHEPHLALDGGLDGLDCIRYLVDKAPDYLKSGGIWLIEMMAGQAESVEALLKRQGSYQNIRIHQDLAGVERFASAERL